MSFLATTQGWHLLVGLCGLAVAGGLFIVPAFAKVQSWAPPQARARTVAAVNVISAGYMAGSGIAVGLAQAAGVGLGPLFLFLGLANLAAFALILRSWGEEGARGLGALLFETLFRVHHLANQYRENGL